MWLHLTTVETNNTYLINTRYVTSMTPVEKGTEIELIDGSSCVVREKFEDIKNVLNTKQPGL